MGIEHDIVCIDYFYVLICSTGYVLCFCALVYVNFGDEIPLRGEEGKTGKNSIFLKNGKTVISVENRKFSKSCMTKRILPFNSSREI